MIDFVAGLLYTAVVVLFCVAAWQMSDGPDYTESRAEAANRACAEHRGTNVYDFSARYVWGTCNDGFAFETHRQREED